MKLVMWSIHDTKAEYYSPPFYTRTFEEAVRAVLATVQKPDHPFSTNTTDYILVKVGEWNEDLGNIEPKHERQCSLDTLINSVSER